MHIRKLDNSEISALTKFWSNIFPEAAPHNKPDIVISDKLAVDDLIFVAEDNNNIIGTCMAGYDGHRGWLYSVAVDPSYRRKGIGTRLVQHATEALQKIGCRKINLQIREGNEEVEDFYISLGFSTEKRISMGALIKDVTNTTLEGEA